MSNIKRNVLIFISSLVLWNIFFYGMVAFIEYEFPVNFAKDELLRFGYFFMVTMTIPLSFLVTMTIDANLKSCKD